MCRNIKSLANMEPPASEDEIRAAAVQFVRKLSGATHPSRANVDAFNSAVDEVAAAASRLIHSIRTSAPPRNREEEARKAQVRARKRFPPRDRHRIDARQTCANTLVTLLTQARVRM